MMFGHHDDASTDTSQQSTNDVSAVATPQPDSAMDDAVNSVPVTVTPVPPVPVPSAETTTPSVVSSAPMISDDTSDDSSDSTTSTSVTDSSTPLPDMPSVTPVVDETPTPVTPAAPETDELLNLKQTALSQLAPLVDHLDQTPEEKFRTTMMMIQANDNQSLLRNAYDIAQQIVDDKVRAQALLDVVNEINYFTQKDSGEGEDNPAASSEGVA